MFRVLPDRNIHECEVHGKGAQNSGTTSTGVRGRDMGIGECAQEIKLEVAEM